MPDSKVPLARCGECPICRNVGMRGRGFLYEGTGTADVVIVGEGPGQQEIINKKVFVGPSGRVLNELLEQYPLGRFWLTNAALCAAFNEDDKKAAALCCKDRLLQEIKDKSPKLIITLGNLPTEMVTGKKGGITQSHGIFVESPLGVVLPTYHPAYILRNPPAMPDLRADFSKAHDYLLGGFEIKYGPSEAEYVVEEDYEKVLRFVDPAPYAVLDLETTGLNPIDDRIVCAVIASHKGNWIIPQDVIYSSGFAQALQSSRAKWSGHNSKFDRGFLKAQLGVTVNFAYDTMILHSLFDERRGIHGLKEICRTLWNAPEWDLPMKKFKNYGEAPREVLYKYAALDGYYQLRLTDHLVDKMKSDERVTRLWDTLLRPAARVLSDMEVRGVQIDQDALKKAIPTYEINRDDSARRLAGLCGHPLNPRSPKQVAVVLFDELKLPMLDGRSTNEKVVLSKLPSNAFVDELLVYRDIEKILSTYLKGIKESVSNDGRVHTTYNMNGAVTGRLSSSSPNLQNIPRDNKDVKGLFVAAPGKVLVYGDYSQLEIRTLAWLSKDPFLVACYRESKDLHAEMAKALFGPDFTKAQRTIAKTCNFRWYYGGGAEALSEDSSVQKVLKESGMPPITVQDAQRLKAIFDAQVEGVLAWKRTVMQFVLKNGYIESPLGRRRHFPYIPQGDKEREEIFREAINMPPQSMGADLTLTALNRLADKGYHPILTVHDSLGLEEDEAQGDKALADMLETMEGVGRELYGDLLPFKAEGSIGKRWSEV